MNLVLLFFNPTTADDLELRQCLSVFFSAFACCNFVAHSALIESAFALTLKTVSNESNIAKTNKENLLNESLVLKISFMRPIRQR